MEESHKQTRKRRDWRTNQTRATAYETGENEAEEAAGKESDPESPEREKETETNPTEV